MKIWIQVRTITDELAGEVLDYDEGSICFEEWDENHIVIHSNGKHLLEKKYLKWLLPFIEQP